MLDGNSVIYLCRVNLDSDLKDTLTFSNKQEQINYFNSRIGKTFTDYSYLRKNNAIRVNGNYDEISKYPYLFLRNNEEDRYYFYFIIDYNYINENVTEIIIKLDSWQTYQFDIQFYNSFVEREHVSDDTIGVHTVPENLELGEYINYDRAKFNYPGNGNMIIVGSTINLEDTSYPDISGNTYGGVYSGIKYYGFVTIESINNMLNSVASAGKLDAIQFMFMLPGGLVDIEGMHIASSITPKVLTWSANKPTDINGYVPKNNKLFTYPYCYMLITNGASESAILQYNLFSDSNCNFKIYSVPTPGMSIRLVPQNYNGTVDNQSEGLNLAKFPICSWNSDVFTNWLTQNGVNVGLSAVGSVGTIAGGVGLMMTGAGALAGAGAIANGLMGVANTVGQVYQHSLQPNQLNGNSNSGDVSFASNETTFCIYGRSIRYEYAKIIDNYFSMYGYKVNSVKIPNINTRKNWNFVKTINCHIMGNIPQSNLLEIQNAFDNGITLWHNPSTIYDYSQDNSNV